MGRRKGQVGAPRGHVASRDAARERADTPGSNPVPGTDGAEPVEPEALVVTHWFESGEAGEPYTATVRLRGERVGVVGKPTAADRFEREEVVDNVIPGSGPVSVSSWVYGLAPGEWTVAGELIRPARHANGARLPERRQRLASEQLRRATWSWRRWTLATAPAEPVKTRWRALVPFARIPAVIPGIWASLALLGVIVALVVQAVILARENVPVGPSLGVSLIVVLSSLLAAKLWYAALHRGPWRNWIGGWSVDGFVLAGPVAAVVALLVTSLPVGVFLDASMPGLFLGVAIGRLGCFFTGCCAGPCTRSRWGIWSSDRRIGARRLPAQLVEAATGLLIATVSGLLVLGDVPTPPGAVFVASFVAYIVARQFLLRLRAERRSFSWRRSRLAAGQKS